MNDRLTSCVVFLKKSVLLLGALLFLAGGSASASLLSAGVDLGAAGQSEDWAVFTLGGGCRQTRSDFSGNSSVNGSVAIAGGGAVSLSGRSSIEGDLYLRNLGALDISRNSEIYGGTYFNSASRSLLDQGARDAEAASRFAFTLASTTGYPTAIAGNRNLSLNGSGVVVLKLSDFTLSGNTSLTLRGNAQTTYIINVKDNFSLTGNSRVQLAGGLTWDNVLFNVRGSGLVSLSGNSSLEGIILATGRTAILSGNSSVRGEIIANSVTLSGNSSVTRPPTVSP